MSTNLGLPAAGSRLPAANGERCSALRRRRAGFILLLCAGLWASVATGAQAPQTGSKGAAASQQPAERVEVPPPPFTEGIFPCTSCHASQKPNRTRRELTEMHTDVVLKHDEQHRWCLDCHDADDRDWLHLASGERIAFSESYLLCGQCHGEKLRDWRAGVHGRRTGEWNGHKAYLLCAHCHSPHQPRFTAIAPKPAPRPPAAVK